MPSLLKGRTEASNLFIEKWRDKRALTLGKGCSISNGKWRDAVQVGGGRRVGAASGAGGGSLERRGQSPSSTLRKGACSFPCPSDLCLLLLGTRVLQATRLPPGVVYEPDLELLEGHLAGAVRVNLFKNGRGLRTGKAFEVKVGEEGKGREVKEGGGKKAGEEEGEEGKRKSGREETSVDGEPASVCLPLPISTSFSRLPSPALPPSLPVPFPHLPGPEHGQTPRSPGSLTHHHRTAHVRKEGCCV
jgi:hypothetical protein